MLTRVVAVVALAAMGTIAVPLAASADVGDGTVTVHVIQEVNANGLVDSTTMEPPLSGVKVYLTDAAGHSITATTGNDGTATFTPDGTALVGGQYRVDVDNPKPGTYFPGHAANGQSAAASLPVDFTDPNNAKLSSDTNFVNVADGQDAYVNTSFWFPGYYCQDNPAVCDALQTWDAPPDQTTQPGDTTLTSAPYDLSQNGVGLATAADTGNVYGIAYDRANKRIFSAAYAKRGASYGPGGPGAIYVTDLTSTTYPLSGITSQFATVPNAGPDDHDMATNQDYGFFDKVGKQSLGDIDVTEDGKYLFGVNEFDKTAFVYDLGTNAYVNSYAIPNPCSTPADWRPMGTGTGLDTNYVGGVCSGQSDQDMSELSAHVYQFDPATGFGAQVLNQSLTYGRGLATVETGCNSSVGGSDTTGRWFSWIADYPDGPNEQNPAGCNGVSQLGYATPMLADIVEETNGDLIVSFRDRFTDQTGMYATEKKEDGSFSIGSASPITGGDLVRGCKLTDGSFVLDPNYAGQSLAPGSVCTDNNTSRGPVNGFEPTTFREFYVGDYRLGGTHQEATFGGIALNRAATTVLSSTMDPNNAAWTQGIGAVGRDGLTATGTQGLDLANGTANERRFGKGAGMADLEVLCDEAPIQIGNRVWLDTDKDGIQDAGEPAVAGVTVHLYDADGHLVGTTTTDGNGNYFFDESNVDGGLDQNSDYTVALDNPDDYAAGGPLAGRAPTVANAGDDAAHDSDGVVADGGMYPQAAVSTGGAGQDDHTFDFGFIQSKVSIGDYVWIDTNGNGVQDGGEAPVPGATVTLLDADGNTVDTTTTDADGFYAFTDLPPNTDYTVQFPPTLTVEGIDYALTAPTQGGDDTADSNPDQTSGQTPVTTPLSGDNLGTPGDTDNPTIDAGYAPLPVSIGDTLWIDFNGNGVQDDGEAPVPGVTVTLLDGDGNQVGTTTTDDTGNYSFTNLTPNTDYTVQFPPTVSVDGIDYVLTPPGQGDDGTADSNPNQQTGQAPVTTPKSGDNSGQPGKADNPTIDAGYVAKPVSIGDYVWIDADSDGVQDDGEKSVPGATVTLLDSDDNAVATTTTDGNGFYAFTDLPPNTDYTVQFPTTVTVDGVGYAITQAKQGDDRAADCNPNPSTGQAPLTTPKSGDNSGKPGKTDNPTIDAGYIVKPVSIGDTVWIDTNGDGIQDKGEAPVPGTTVTLLDGDGNTVATTTTDDNGFYSFTDLPPDTDYTVQFPTTVTVDGVDYTLTPSKQGDEPGKDSNPDQQSGMAPVTTPKTGDNSGEPGKADNPTIDAGYIPKPVSIGDYVWIDSNSNGVQDQGEKPVPNATVTLLDADGNVAATTNTDGSGYYSFTDLPPGTDFTVQFPTTVTADGVTYVLTGPSQGSNPGTDSNPNASTGNAPVTTPTSGGNSGAPGKADNPTIDAGYIPMPVSIGDYLWIDADGNGVQDSGEKPVPGATVTLLDADGNTVATTTTTDDGFYAFTGLTPNTKYGVKFPTTVTVDAVSYSLTQPGQGGNPGLDSDADQSTGIAWVTTPKSGNNSGKPGQADVPAIDAGYASVNAAGTGGLSYTGVNTVGMITGAVLFLICGAVMLLAGRRRKRAVH